MTEEIRFLGNHLRHSQIFSFSTFVPLCKLCFVTHISFKLKILNSFNSVFNEMFLLADSVTVKSVHANKLLLFQIRTIPKLQWRNGR